MSFQIVRLIAKYLNFIKNTTFLSTNTHDSETTSKIVPISIVPCQRKRIIFRLNVLHTSCPKKTLHNPLDAYCHKNLKMILKVWQWFCNTNIFSAYKSEWLPSRKMSIVKLERSFGFFCSTNGLTRHLVPSSSCNLTITVWLQDYVCKRPTCQKFYSMIGPKLWRAWKCGKFTSSTIAQRIILSWGNIQFLVYSLPEQGFMKNRAKFSYFAKLNSW